MTEDQERVIRNAPRQFWLGWAMGFVFGVGIVLMPLLLGGRVPHHEDEPPAAVRKTYVAPLAVSSQAPLVPAAWPGDPGHEQVWNYVPADTLPSRTHLDTPHWTTPEEADSLFWSSLGLRPRKEIERDAAWGKLRVLLDVLLDIRELQAATLLAVRGMR